MAGIIGKSIERWAIVFKSEDTNVEKLKHELSIYGDVVGTKDSVFCNDPVKIFIIECDEFSSMMLKLDYFCVHSMYSPRVLLPTKNLDEALRIANSMHGMRAL